jgi:hypothetical protein
VRTLPARRFRQFQQRGSEADNLLVVGYSFRDPHVNETIARWFNADDTRAIVLLSPSELDELSAVTEFVWALRRASAVPTASGEATPMRFRHVQGRTRDVLPEAIHEAARRVSILADT